MTYPRSMSTDQFKDIIRRYPNDAEWKLLARAGEKVPAIKTLRTEEVISLKEAKDTMEVYLEWYKAGTLPEYVPPTSTVIRLNAEAALTIHANPDGTYTVERTQLISDSITFSELLKLVAHQSSTSSRA